MFKFSMIKWGCGIADWLLRFSRSPRKADVMRLYTLTWLALAHMVVARCSSNVISCGVSRV